MVISRTAKWLYINADIYNEYVAVETSVFSKSVVRLIKEYIEDIKLNPTNIIDYRDKKKENTRNFAIYLDDDIARELQSLHNDIFNDNHIFSRFVECLMRRYCDIQLMTKHDNLVIRRDILLKKVNEKDKEILNVGKNIDILRREKKLFLEELDRLKEIEKNLLSKDTNFEKAKIIDRMKKVGFVLNRFPEVSFLSNDNPEEVNEKDIAKFLQQIEDGELSEENDIATDETLGFIRESIEMSRKEKEREKNENKTRI